MVIDEVKVEDLPEEFTLTVTTTSINNPAIRKALEEGSELEFARLSDRGYSMRIK